MSKTFQLSDDDHERIYAEIERDKLQGTTPVERPRVIITGGQPGSGKSKLIGLSKEEFPDGNVVVINGDELRDYHPQADKILKLDDKRFAEHTDHDSRSWTKELFDKAIEEKRNIIFESTMREAGPISKTMMRLKENGYEVTAKVVATHERNSTAGVFMRYETQKAQKGYGRFSAMESHDAGYEGMPKTLEHIEKNQLADKIEVYDRSGSQLYSNEVKDGRWKNDPRAVEAVESERQREPTATERQNFQSEWKRINTLMEKRQATLREFDQARKVYDKYNRQLERSDKRQSPSKSRATGDKVQEQPRDSTKRPEQASSRSETRSKPISRSEAPRDVQLERNPGKLGKARAISGKEFTRARNLPERAEHQPSRTGPTKQISGRDFAQSASRELSPNPMERQVAADRAGGIERSGPTDAGRQMGSGQDKGLGGRIAGDRGGFEGGGMER